MIPVLGIPYYNRASLLVRCVRSIDVWVGTLVIVNNGPNELPDIPVPNKTKLVVVKHPNAGVASSWNEIIKLFPADFWLLSNDDIQFTPGDLSKLGMAAHSYMDTPIALYGNHGASWWTINSMAIDKVGLFDENIYPAYLEDCDWSYRADLLGVKRMTIEGTSAIHGDNYFSGSCTVNSDPKIAVENMRTHAGNFEYYKRKWGGINEKETFKTPFNDPHWPIWAWKMEMRTRLNQQWKLQ